MIAQAPVTVSIDPGLRKCGISVYVGSVLFKAARVDNPDMKSKGTTACRSMVQAVRAWIDAVLAELAALWRVAVVVIAVLVFEWPQVYHEREKQEGDLNDLPPMAGVDTGIACLYPSVPTKDYKPREWKGQVGKKVMNGRVWRRLTPEEQGRVERMARGGLSHDALDGVGVGLHHLGRLEPERVYLGE